MVLGEKEICAAWSHQAACKLLPQPPMENGIKGKWAFVPLDKWEVLPHSYYSFRASQIYLSLAMRVPDADVSFCMKNDVLPLPKLSPKQLAIFVAGARAGAAGARRTPSV